MRPASLWHPDAVPLREDDTICAVASLEEIVPEKADGGAGGNTEPCGGREVVTGRSTSADIWATEDKEHGRSEASRSDNRLRQTGLLRGSHASGPTLTTPTPNGFKEVSVAERWHRLAWTLRDVVR
ncbi:hypothetical protein GCM10019016_084210 [Streptomyces prasinosporus]|uniref:Uncharacterized protein n=1 Tax=Streptomyces prasinosporus TaxID=68256 RepID=A0ABP6U1S6_9ACTN|nr:hypothetical protein GCM10010332_30210 [Streptomyces albogriseolus]